LDNSVGDADSDEIYAGVWFKRADGTTYGIRSNMRAGWWGLTAVPGGTFTPPLPKGIRVPEHPRC
jgi:hypothetical protein